MYPPHPSTNLSAQGWEKEAVGGGMDWGHGWGLGCLPMGCCTMLYLEPGLQCWLHIPGQL